MSDPSHPLGSVSEDEQRLIRLFRCLDNDARSGTLQRLGKRLMMGAAVDPILSLYENPERMTMSLPTCSSTHIWRAPTDMMFRYPVTSPILKKVKKRLCNACVEISN